jgi:hypothetical protein
MEMGCKERNKIGPIDICSVMSLAFPEVFILLAYRVSGMEKVFC